MNKNWMIKIGSPILALALISGCQTTNDNNDDGNVPQDTDTQENENTKFENTRYNEQNMDKPNDSGVKNFHRQHDGIQKKSKW